MTAPAPPALTVRYDGSERTFAAGHDVVVGRDLRADMRITHPLISRAHLLLRFDQGRWLAIDNGSLNGTFANGRKVPVVDIRDGQSINIGNPDGPQLSFEVGRHRGWPGARLRPSRWASRWLSRPRGRPRRRRVSPCRRPRPGHPGHQGARPARTARRRRGRPVNRRGHPGSRYPTSGRPAARLPDQRAAGNFQPHPRPGCGTRTYAAPQTQMSPVEAKSPEVSNLATKMFQALLPSRSGSIQKPSRLGRRSAAPPTTTSSSRTSWRRAITRS